MRTVPCVALMLALSVVSAQARGHHRHHHYASRHHHTHVAESSGSIVKVDTEAGPIRVAKAYADRFVGFINALVDLGYKPKDIGCYSPTGHIRNSKHHWGGACDIDQDRRDVTAWFMRDVTAIAHKFNLTDGCEWHNKDCGHVEVPGSTRIAARTHRTRYAHHRRPHYAGA